MLIHLDFCASIQSKSFVFFPILGSFVFIFNRGYVELFAIILGLAFLGAALSWLYYWLFNKKRKKKNWTAQVIEKFTIVFFIFSISAAAILTVSVSQNMVDGMVPVFN